MRVERSDAGWTEWCRSWREPAVLLAAAGGLGALSMWGLGMVMDQNQLHGRVASLEKRSDEQVVVGSRFQEQIGQKLEGLDAKLNQLSLQFAAQSPRLEGMFDLLRAMKENQTSTDQRIIDANRVRDEAARSRDADTNRRLDTLSSMIRLDRH